MLECAAVLVGSRLVFTSRVSAVFSDFESLDEETQVVATARGKFTSQGGVLSSPESGVSIVIPEGAIPSGVEQEIYFKVCKDNNFMPPLDADRGGDAILPPSSTQPLRPPDTTAQISSGHSKHRALGTH